MVRTKETADLGPHVIKFSSLMHNAENPLTMAQRISLSLERLAGDVDFELRKHS